MIAAQTEAERFIDWLERYNHHGNYSNLGQALLSWCTADGGIFRLDCDYAQFLQMVIAVLLKAKGTLRVGIDVSEEKYEELPLPTSFEGWLPDQGDFFAALRQAISDARRHG
jgi:hypothetical protein